MPGVGEFLDAFWELSTDRAYGMSVGPVPSSAIERWADRHELDPVERQQFRGYIRVMDRVYLDHVERKTSSSTRARSSSKPTPAVSMTPMSAKLFDTLFIKNT